MSKLPVFRQLLTQRPVATAEEIFGLFERTVENYEEEPSHLKELLDAAQLQRSVLPAAVQQHFLVIKEEVSPEWSPSVDQEEPESLHIKEVKEEAVRETSQQVNGLEEADIKFLFTDVHMSIEGDGEKPHSAQLHQSEIEDNTETKPQTETHGEDYAGSVPVRNLDPNNHLQTNRDKKASDSSQTEISNVFFDVCRKRFAHHGNLKVHMRIHTGEKPFGCDVCGKRFAFYGNLKVHMRVHTGEKPFGCDVCRKRFSHHISLKIHTRVHRRETVWF